MPVADQSRAEVDMIDDSRIGMARPLDAGHAESLADAVRAVIPGFATSRVETLPRAGGFTLGLASEDGDVDLGMRGSTVYLDHLAMVLSAGSEEDDDALDPRALAVARATLSWARPRGATRLVIASHWRRTHETRGWVKAGALPVAGGSRLMTEMVSYNLDVLVRSGRCPGEAHLAIARRLQSDLTAEPHLLRALATMPEPVRPHRGPTLGHAALRGATWPVEIDLAEPSTASIFAAACGDGPKGVGREAYRGSGREAMVREGFSTDDLRLVWGR